MATGFELDRKRFDKLIETINEKMTELDTDMTPEKWVDTLRDYWFLVVDDAATDDYLKQRRRIKRREQLQHHKDRTAELEKEEQDDTEAVNGRNNGRAPRSR